MPEGVVEVLVKKGANMDSNGNMDSNRKQKPDTPRPGAPEAMAPKSETPVDWQRIAEARALDVEQMHIIVDGYQRANRGLKHKISDSSPVGPGNTMPEGVVEVPAMPEGVVEVPAMPEGVVEVSALEVLKARLDRLEHMVVPSTNPNIQLAEIQPRKEPTEREKMLFEELELQRANYRHLQVVLDNSRNKSAWLWRAMKNVESRALEVSDPVIQKMALDVLRGEVPDLVALLRRAVEITSALADPLGPIDQEVYLDAAEFLVVPALKELLGEDLQDTEERKCRICGCTEIKACINPETGESYHWAEKYLCGACHEKLMDAEKDETREVTPLLESAAEMMDTPRETEGGEQPSQDE